MKRQLERAFRRDLLRTAGPTIFVILLAFGAALFFVKPAPPKTIVLASAPDEGGSRYYARRYQEILKRSGITLEVRETKGSLANIALLDDDDGDVDVAFVLSAIDGAQKTDGVVSLGALSYVPLWVVYRGDPIEDIRDLKGKRVSIGSTESGTHAIALTILAANGADKPPTELTALERDPAIEKLKKGELDAAFIVAPAEAPQIKKLAAEPGLHVLSLLRADAYARRFPSLAKVTVPRGVFDLAADVPQRDLVMLSPTANLLARDTLHPALAYLLMRAASEVHGRPGILEKSGEFPAPREAGFPLSSEAKRYYQAGVPFLQRYLPFWAANLVDRLWVMLVPIIAVVLPLGRAVPALYRWRIRSRVFRWYARLKQIELQLDESPGPAELEKMLERLDEIERSVNQIRAPLAFTDNLYSFREHVDIVRRRVIRRLTEGNAAARPQASA